MKLLSQDAIKKNVGEKAASFIQDDMFIGLGTGSTITFFIDYLIKRVKDGLKITAVATSKRTLEHARKGGIPIRDYKDVTQVDLTVDGADEINPANQMIKGGGGALVREKILATSSHKMLVIIDESKLVTVLGKFGVPIEIIPFCHLTTLAKIKKLGFDGQMRRQADDSLYVTDNGNYIFDIHTPKLFPNPKRVHDQLSVLAGVVETGFFFDLPVQVLVGYKNGNVNFKDALKPSETLDDRID